MANKISNTPGVAGPFGAYSHACEVSPGSQILYLAGQVGVRADETIPESVEDQTEIACRNILVSLHDANMDAHDIVKVTVALLDRADLKSYRVGRDRVFGDIKPPTTLFIVSGLANPAWRVEIEVTAAK
jgi:enamine deaminase RidA (YjgF/YER057c/UK114 family)